MSIWLIIPIIILAAIFFAAFYLFNIYEIKYNFSNLKLTKENPDCIIEAVPLNSFGEKAPFRNVPFTISIISGDSLIKISDGDNISQKIISVKSDSISSEVEIDLKSKFDLFPVRKKIKIN